MKSPLYFSRENNDHYMIEDDQLTCQNEKVPVVSKIPRFVTAENYAAAFGDQWNRFAQTQLDSYSNLTLTEERVKRCFGGEETLKQIKGKTVLEAGCGAGRFTEVLLKYGATVVSVDLSNAVEANQRNFPQNDRHFICQADINKLPFRENFFDVVMCLGVVQHTASPETTIKSLFSHVKPSGMLVIDHYRPTVSFYTRLLPLYRLIFKKIRPANTLRFCEKLVDTFFPLHKALGKTTAGFALLSRFSPIVTYFHSLPSLDLKQQREWAILDTHDSLFDHYKHLRSQKDVEKILKNVGAKKYKCWKGGNGIEAWAIK
jgi:2-polyprenyl-3-methyl-5-hydroxy-6-metoxy-1,4-benzoquinol methylase